MLLRKLKKDIRSFSLRRGTIIQVADPDAAQRAVEDKLAFNEEPGSVSESL